MNHTIRAQGLSFVFMQGGFGLRRHFCAFRLVIAAGLCASAALPELQAQTNYVWNNGAGGSWQTGSNWTPSGVPGSNSGDRASLVGAGPFTISLSANASLHQVVLGNWASASAAASNITLDLSGNTINALSTAGGQNASLTGYASNDSGNLSMTITNGTFNGALMELGTNGGGFYGYNRTAVRVSGSTMVMNLQSDGVTTPNNAFNQVGRSSGGIGEFIVDNGAQVNISHSSLQVNGNAGNTTPGLIRVTGSGSEINAATGNTSLSVNRIMVRVASGVNASSVARMEVLDQASFATDDLSIGMGSVGASGTLLISGSSSVAAKRVFVAGGVGSGAQAGSAAASATGLLQVADGADATITQELSVYGSGTVELDRATLNVSGVGSLAVFNPSSTLEIKLYSAAQDAALMVQNGLTITNANLTLTLADSFNASLNDVFTIVGYGSRTGTFAGLANLAAIQVDDYTFQIQYNASDITLLTTAVPEPGVAALAVLGVGMLVIRRLRRKDAR